MTRLQRARRIYTWRGSVAALLFFTVWMLLSSYCSQLTQ
jgi:uncharacterized membrane protein (DUF485 family)